MSMKILKRGPNGKFIGWGEAIFEWLPELLNGSPWNGVALGDMLKAAGGWCQHQAAKEYDQAAESLRENPRHAPDPIAYAGSCAADAAQWFRRKELLDRAIEELKKA